MLPARLWQTCREFWTMPRVGINLMRDAAAKNDPFYAQLVQDFYRNARRRHPKYLIVRRMTCGIALMHLPRTFAEYFARLKSSARRNFKQAVRAGCEFRRIDFNDHWEAVREICASAYVRHGEPVPKDYQPGERVRCTDPPSRDPTHDYPYFGVFVGGKLVAYAGCFVSGELCLVERIFGHSQWLDKSVVPFLIIEIARYLQGCHPLVKYYAYGSYFGAGETLKRFKRKFNFRPNYVTWVLDSVAAAAPHGARPLENRQTCITPENNEPCFGNKL
jgi:hypothetical protein